MVAGAKSFLALLGISRDTHQICVMRSGKVREKCAEKVRESQGIQIKLTGGNPKYHVVSTWFVDISGRPISSQLCGEHLFVYNH